jgi:hypothetical protein
VRFIRVGFARLAGIGSILMACLFMQALFADEFTLPPVGGLGLISNDDLRFRFTQPGKTPGLPVESIWAPLSPYPLSPEELSLALDAVPARSFYRGRSYPELINEPGDGELTDRMATQIQKHATDPDAPGASESHKPDLGVHLDDDPYDESLILNWRFGF